LDKYRENLQKGNAARRAATMSLPVQLDPDGIKAEYRDGVLALYLPRSERDKPRAIKIS